MIRLRPMEQGDLLIVRKWRNLPEVARYMYSDHEISEEEHFHWYSQIKNDTSCKYWIVEFHEEPVGVANIAGISTRDRHANWAFYLASDRVRGRGVGSFVEYSMLTYAFDEIDLHRLCCEVLAFNDAVVRMHESFGFQREGILRKHVFKNGAYADVVLLGILKNEWIDHKERIEKRLADKGLLVTA